MCLNLNIMLGMVIINLVFMRKSVIPDSVYDVGGHSLKLSRITCRYLSSSQYCSNGTIFIYYRHQNMCCCYICVLCKKLLNRYERCQIHVEPFEDLNVVVKFKLTIGNYDNCHSQSNIIIISRMKS